VIAFFETRKVEEALSKFAVMDFFDVMFAVIVKALG
jgi:hypothetical protein